MAEVMGAWLEPNFVLQLLAAVFHAVLFLQSGVDKVVDKAGNLEWLRGHFKSSPLGTACPSSRLSFSFPFPLPLPLLLLLFPVLFLSFLFSTLPSFPSPLRFGSSFSFLFSSHFSVFLAAPFVPMLVLTLTILELAAGAVCFVGALSLLSGEKKSQIRFGADFVV